MPVFAPPLGAIVYLIPCSRPAGNVVRYAMRPVKFSGEAPNSMCLTAE